MFPRLRHTLAASLLGVATLSATEPADIAPAINALGLDLYRQQIKTTPGKGVLLSPYSVATALAMTYAGADGDTKAEMARVLHFPADSSTCSQGFRYLQQQLQDLELQSGRETAEQIKEGGKVTVLTLNVANRVFVQKGFNLQPDFLREMSKEFGVTPGTTDFKHDPEGSRLYINRWVQKFTNGRILDLLPAGQPPADTRVALVNALYLKAAWQDHFREELTEPRPFHLSATATAPVPTMLRQDDFRYQKNDGYTVVAIPYQTGRLQFVLFVPDDVDGLAALEQKLTAEDLAACTSLGRRDVILYLPKFNLEPATMPLGEALQSLGLQTAFDKPAGSANFGRMAARTSGDYLAIGDVFHKTWLSLDENGTEAAAATAVTMVALGSAPGRVPPPPVVVRADRPFLFAIQHVDSGACLFTGRVTDPR